MRSYNMRPIPCLALSQHANRGDHDRPGWHVEKVQHANRDERHANRDERGRRGRPGGRPLGKMLGCEILVDSVIAANPDHIVCNSASTLLKFESTL